MPDGTWAARRDASDGRKCRIRDGDALRAARNALGLSQRGLAAKLNCQDRIIGHLETGERTTVYAALAADIEDALGAARGSLFDPVEE